MSPTRKRILVALKTVVAIVLIVAVGRHFAKLTQEPGVWDRVRAARVEYLVPAGLLYLAAHTIWGTFWVQLLRSRGADVSWGVGIRAYFVSQFGKYVPGKAWVLVLRVMMLRGRGLSPAVVAVTATYETLTSMAAGAIIAVALLPWAGDEIGVRFDSWKGVALLGIAALPLALGLAIRYVKRMPNPPMWLLLRGLAQDAVGWVLLAVSLWLTVRAVVSDEIALTGPEFLQDLAAVTLSYVAGFVVLVSPGGLGGREFVLQQVLTPGLTPVVGPSAAGGVAAVTALILRLVWTAFEVVFAVGLWAFGKPSDRAAGVPAPETLATTGSARDG